MNFIKITKNTETYYTMILTILNKLLRTYNKKYNNKKTFK